MRDPANDTMVSRHFRLATNTLPIRRVVLELEWVACTGMDGRNLISLKFELEEVVHVLFHEHITVKENDPLTGILTCRAQEELKTYVHHIPTGRTPLIRIEVSSKNAFKSGGAYRSFVQVSANRTSSSAN